MKSFTELIDAVRQGDQAAFSELYERCAPRAMAVIRRYYDDEDGRQDILQETFLTVWQKIGDLQDPEKVQNWINVIAANTAVRRNAMEQKYRPVSIPELELENDDLPFEIEDERIEVNPEADLDRKETAKAVESIMNSCLSVDQKHALWMFYAQGIKIREMAEAFGESENTVKSRLFQARKRLASRKDDFRRHGIDLAVFPIGFLVALTFSTDTYAAAAVAAGSAAAVTAGSGAGSGTGAAASAAAGSGAGAAAGGSHPAGGLFARLAAVLLGGAVIGGSIFALRQPSTKYNTLNNRQAVQVYREVLKTDPQYFLKEDESYQRDTSGKSAFALTDLDENGIYELFVDTPAGSYLLFHDSEEELQVLKTGEADALFKLQGEIPELGISMERDSFGVIPGQANDTGEIGFYTLAQGHLEETGRLNYFRDRAAGDDYLPWLRNAAFTEMIPANEENFQKYLGGVGLTTPMTDYKGFFGDFESEASETAASTSTSTLPEAAGQDASKLHPYEGVFVRGEDPDHLSLKEEDGSINPWIFRIIWDEETAGYRINTIRDPAEDILELQWDFTATEEMMERLEKGEVLYDLWATPYDGERDYGAVHYMGLRSGDDCIELRFGPWSDDWESTEADNRSMLFWRYDDFYGEYERQFADQEDPYAGVYEGDGRRYTIYKNEEDGYGQGSYFIRGMFPDSAYAVYDDLQLESPILDNYRIRIANPGPKAGLYTGEWFYKTAEDNGYTDKSWTLNTLHLEGDRLTLEEPISGKQFVCEKVAPYMVPAFWEDDSTNAIGDQEKTPLPELKENADAIKAFTDAHLSEYTVKSLREPEPGIYKPPIMYGDTWYEGERPVIRQRTITRDTDYNFEYLLSEELPYDAEGKTLSQRVTIREYYMNPAADPLRAQVREYLEAEDENGNLVRIYFEPSSNYFREPAYIIDADGTIYGEDGSLSDLIKFWCDYVYGIQGDYPQLMAVALLEARNMAPDDMALSSSVNIGYLAPYLPEGKTETVKPEDHLVPFFSPRQDRTGEPVEKAEWNQAFPWEQETTVTEDLPEWAEPLPAEAYEQEANYAAVKAYRERLQQLDRESGSDFRAEFALMDIDRDGIYEMQVYIEDRSDIETSVRLLYMQKGELKEFPSPWHSTFDLYGNGCFASGYAHMGYYETVWQLKDGEIRQLEERSLSQEILFKEAMEQSLTPEEQAESDAFINYGSVRYKYVEASPENLEKYLSGAGRSAGIADVKEGPGYVVPDMAP